ncbi:hypothetical protein Moror_11970 [Moniliophthora roreri MCA 2997]|uniref:Uncharacterized protein n=1 Tax=Moniliophthora roreri (strain MCA 2997) TaxID=1381753 RepID=V2X3J4_MONRO|nr:hypothetical protein Moror_11970 [Moniliophthora roreri MCA 2997]
MQTEYSDDPVQRDGTAATPEITECTSRTMKDEHLFPEAHSDQPEPLEHSSISHIPHSDLDAKINEFRIKSVDYASSTSSKSQRCRPVAAKVYCAKKILGSVDQVLSQIGKQTLTYQPTEELVPTSPAAPSPADTEVLENDNESSTPSGTMPDRDPLVQTPKLNRILESIAATRRRTWAIPGDHIWLLRFLGWYTHEELVRKLLPIDWYSFYYHIFHSMKYRLEAEEVFETWRKDYYRRSLEHKEDPKKVERMIKVQEAVALRFGYEGRGRMAYPFSVTLQSGEQVTLDERKKKHDKLEGDSARASTSTYATTISIKEDNELLGYDRHPNQWHRDYLRNTTTLEDVEGCWAGGMGVRQFGRKLKGVLGVDRLTGTSEESTRITMLDIAQSIKNIKDDMVPDDMNDIYDHVRQAFKKEPDLSAITDCRMMLVLNRMLNTTKDVEAREQTLTEFGMNLCKELGVDDLSTVQELIVYRALKQMLGISPDDTSWPLDVVDERPFLLPNTKSTSEPDTSVGTGRVAHGRGGEASSTVISTTEAKKVSVSNGSETIESTTRGSLRREVAVVIADLSGKQNRALDLSLQDPAVVLSSPSSHTRSNSSLIPQPSRYSSPPHPPTQSHAGLARAVLPGVAKGKGKASDEEMDVDERETKVPMAGPIVVDSEYGTTDFVQQTEERAQGSHRKRKVPDAGNINAKRQCVDVQVGQVRGEETPAHLPKLRRRVRRVEPMEPPRRSARLSGKSKRLHEQGGQTRASNETFTRSKTRKKPVAQPTGPLRRSARLNNGRP